MARMFRRGIVFAAVVATIVLSGCASIRGWGPDKAVYHINDSANARALLGAEASAQQLAAWRAVISKGLSVRDTEALIRRLKAEKAKPKATRNRSEDIYLSGLAEDLSRHFGTKIMIKKHGKIGKVEIEFYSNDDLERLINRLRQTKL